MSQQSRKNDRPGREHKPEDRHLKTYMNELLDHETKRKLEALRDELAKGETNESNTL